MIFSLLFTTFLWIIDSEVDVNIKSKKLSFGISLGSRADENIVFSRQWWPPLYLHETSNKAN